MVCYRLQLLPDYRINPSFHVSLLRPVVAGPLQESEVWEVPPHPLDIGGPGVFRSLHTGFQASGLGNSVPRGVGGVRTGGEVLGPGGGRVGPFNAAGVPLSPEGSPCASPSGSSPRQVSANRAVKTLMPFANTYL